jgi:hypothetical protein
MIDYPGVAVFVFLAIGAIALFSFLSVATWAGTRQAEREAYYKAEMMKKIAETGGERNPALEYLREQEHIKAEKRLGGIKLGGLINIGVGFGLMMLLKGLVHGPSVYLSGTIPLFIGLAMLAYAFWFAPERSAETK